MLQTNAKLPWQQVAGLMFMLVMKWKLPLYALLSTCNSWQSLTKQSRLWRQVSLGLALPSKAGQSNYTILPSAKISANGLLIAFNHFLLFITRLVWETGSYKYLGTSRNYWGFGLRPSSDILKNTTEPTFLKLDLFPFSGEEGVSGVYIAVVILT
jgi:hypothetical protein